MRCYIHTIYQRGAPVRGVYTAVIGAKKAISVHRHKMGVLYCRAKGRTKKKRRGRKPPAFLWRLLIVGYVHLGYVYLFFMSIFLAELWSLQIHRVMATSTGENHLGAGAFHRGSGTLYDFLGISPRSSQAEIKRVFRRLAVRMHPDKIGPFESAAAERKANDLFVKVGSPTAKAVLACASAATCVRYTLVNRPRRAYSFSLGLAFQDSWDFALSWTVWMVWLV